MPDEPIRFSMDGQQVEASPGETLWEVARRQQIEIPHLCHSGEPGYPPDGNCRVCMVEIEGERVLAASCVRQPTPGMKVITNTDRADKSRRLVMELLLADQPRREQAHDRNSRLWHWADTMGLQASRFPAGQTPAADRSHPAMAVHLDACIQCGLCVRGCRDVQVNDVIGMSGRGHQSKIVFDFDDPMGQSTCVGCGECVQACPTGALMPATLVDAAGVGRLAVGETSDQQVDSVCPYCGVGCQLTYHLQNEKLLHVEGSNGPANENRLCVKGRFGFDYVTHSDRLLKPLVRKSGIPKSAHPDVNPANPSTHFREATWEEAIELAAQGLKSIRTASGDRALAGFGSAKCSNEEAYLFQKLVRTGFGSNNVDHCTRLCHASSVAALLETIGSGAVTAPFTHAKYADVIILIGCNPAENHPVAATFFKNAARRGAKLIVMDPRGQAMRRHASHIIQFRSGRDVALLNAMMHVIVSEELYDQAYVDQHTEGFQSLREHLQDYSPEAMQEVCGIEPEQIREISRLYATAKAAMIFWGMGISQHVHGTDNARCLISLALMCGQVGRPGTGLHPLRGQNNVQGASDAGLIPMMLPDYGRVGVEASRQVFEQLWSTKLDAEPGLTVVEIIDAIHAGDIRGMYIMGENPAMSDPDLAHARTALAKLDHLVVQDLFLTETACYADVVLPASAWPEKDGTVTNSSRIVQRGRRALPLPGEAREDWRIIQSIARGMGLDWKYEHPRDVFEEMARGMPSLSHITWERLEQQNGVTYPCDGPQHAGHEVVFGDGFPTPSGRGRFVPAGLVAPDELPDDDYPMIFSTARLLEHWHTGSMTRRSDVLDELEPEPIATLCGKELRRLGIEPGDRLRVSTRRGSIELVARQDNGVAEGSIFMPFCFAEAAANLLTNPALDPVGKIPEFKFCAARVEKINPCSAAERD